MLLTRRFAAGEIIIREGDEGQHVYLIMEGRVKVLKQYQGRQAVLASLGVGESFGEMSLVEDKPRSATVIAVEKTTLGEIDREHFIEMMRHDPESGFLILRTVFERLREASALVIELRRRLDLAHGASTPPEEPEADEQDGQGVYLQGLTPLAVAALPENPYRIPKFPFLIGRKGGSPLSHNDLAIEDPDEWVSQHHVRIVLRNGSISLWDRGSTSGTVVDGRRIGGGRDNPTRITLAHDHGIFTLGGDGSQYRFGIYVGE